MYSLIQSSKNLKYKININESFTNFNFENSQEKEAKAKKYLNNLIRNNFGSYTDGTPYKYFINLSVFMYIIRILSSGIFPLNADKLIKTNQYMMKYFLKQHELKKSLYILILFLIPKLLKKSKNFIKDLNQLVILIQ